MSKFKNFDNSTLRTFFLLSVCNLKDYNTVFNLQRTHFTNVFIQSLEFVAFDVSVAFSRYIPRVMLLSGLQAPYINDLNRPPNGKSKNHGPLSNPFNSGPIQQRFEQAPKWKNRKTMSPYRMPSIWALFRSTFIDFHNFRNTIDVVTISSSNFVNIEM